MNFNGEQRSNETHESSTDPDAKLARKLRGKKAKLSYFGNLLIENGNGLIVNTELLQANGTAERDAALLIPAEQRVTLGADKGDDTKAFVAECLQTNVTPPVAQTPNAPAGVPSTHAPPATQVTRSVSRNASGLRNASAG